MPRSRVPHYEMCKMFKSIHDEKFGGDYLITTLDAKEAHEMWVLNGELGEEKLRPLCGNYFASDFPGWISMGFPAWQFFKHINSFAPKVEQKPIRRATTYCGKCGTTHSINDPCSEQRDVGKLIGSIGRKVE